MPFYEYACQACGAHHEAMQKMSDAPLRKCPACGKAKLKRLISAPVFRLKGGGWYETDFKSDKESKRNLHGEDKADAAPAAKAADDSKPAAAVAADKSVAAKPAAAKPKAAPKKAAKRVPRARPAAKARRR